MEESGIDVELLTAILNAILEEIRMHPLLGQEAERDGSRFSSSFEATPPATVRTGGRIGLVWASLRAVIELLGAVPTSLGVGCVTALDRLRDREQRN